MEEKMTGRIIFSDLDGTLINDQGQITPLTQKAIRQQVLAGNVFVPVSGRMPNAVMNVVGQMTQVCPLIAYNGALILDEVGNVLTSNFLTAKQALKLCRRLDELTQNTFWGVFSGNEWYRRENKKSAIISFTEKALGVESQQATEAQLAQLKGVHKVMLMGEPTELDRLQQPLQREFPEFYFVKSGPQYLEIMLHGVSKKAGVKQMAQQMHVDLAACYAFGDNYNDEGMLSEVGHSYLMGNAPQDLQQKFPNHTLDNNHDGLATVLNKI